MALSVRTAALLALAAASVAAASGGCRVVAGVDERVAACGGDLGAGACGVCQAEHCCEYATARGANEDWGRLRACRLACRNDEACEARCDVDHPDGRSVASALDECARRQCSTQCGSWACVGSVAWPSPQNEVSVTVTLNDALDGHPLEGLSIASCTYADPDCEAPVATSDANGSARLTMRAPAESFLRVWGVDGPPDAGGGSRLGYRALAFDTPPPAADGAILREEILSLDAARQLAGVLGPIDLDGAGGVLVTATDCARRWASGVVLDITPRPPESIPFYVQGSLPNRSLEETTTRGVGGFGNVPGGVFVVSASSAAAGGVFASRRLVVRPGYITFTSLKPSPAGFL
jgi:hypothetical protein